MIRVIKKDGTKEDFNVQKVVVAVNKSAYRALIKFTDEELDYICRFVEEKVQTLGIQDVPIAEMHNVVEGALEKGKSGGGKNVIVIIVITNRTLYRCWMKYIKRASPSCISGYKEKQQHGQCAGINKEKSDL